MADSQALKGGGLSVASMIKNAAGTPKMYSNHANHPGFTTSTFNQLKSPTGNSPPISSNVPDADRAIAKAEADKGS